MVRHGVSLRVLHPEPVPPERQKDLSCDTFWKLMDRWKVPTDRALTLIGRDAEQASETERPSFPLSDEQAKVVSCLLEIELTLTVAGAGRARSRKRSRAPAHETLPLDAMGRCDPSRAGMVLWSLNQTGGVKLELYARAQP
jgi:hypothetical protein